MYQQEYKLSKLTNFDLDEMLKNSVSYLGTFNLAINFVLNKNPYTGYKLSLLTQGSHSIKYYMLGGLVVYIFLT